MLARTVNVCGTLVRLETDRLGWLAKQVFVSLSQFDSVADGRVDVCARFSHSPLSVKVVGTDLVRPASDADLPAALSSALTMAVVSKIGDRLVIHSAAVARGGRAIVLPAASGYGKTTLTLALLSRGWDFISDELVIVDEVAAVTPYPRAMNVRAPTRAVVPEAAGWVRYVRTTGPSSASRPAFLATPLRQPDLAARPVVAAIVFPRYSPGAATRMTSLSPGAAALRLLQQLVNACALGAQAFHRSVGLAKRCNCYDLTVGSLAEACAQIAGVL